jgi:hypothetical protein
VEGYEDLYSVVGLMRAHIAWPQELKDAPVFIDIGKSADEILEDDYLTTIFKARGIKYLGVMLDADSKLSVRYNRLRKLFGAVFPDMPADLQNSGLIIHNEEKSFGVWIMPDNTSDGGLETFLRHLIPDQSQPLWQLASDSVTKAREIGAPCREVHVAKANLFTWLAFQDPPGQKPGTALTKKILDPYAPSAAAFVKWFRDLYAL